MAPTSRLNRFFSGLAATTMLATLLPFGAAAPATAWSGTNIRDEKVLRTSGASLVTYNAGATCNGGARACTSGLSNDGLPAGYSNEGQETNSLAELDFGQTFAAQNGAYSNRGSAQTGGDLADSQIVRLRATFFKNNTNRDLPQGGAASISAAYVQLRDRSTGEWAYIKVSPGANGVWESGANVLSVAGDDTISVFCRTASGGRRWATNNGSANYVDQNDDPGNAVAGDVDTPAIACGSGNRPFLSSVEFAGDVASANDYGVSGTSSESLNLQLMFAFPTPEVAGPVEIWTSVEDRDSYADGWDSYGAIQLGTAPTVTGAPFTGVGSTSVARGQNLPIYVSVEDKDGEGDVRAVIATLVGQNGANVQLIFYHRVGQAYGTPGTPGTGSSIAVSDFEDRFQVYDSARGRYLPAKPTDTGTIATSLGTLDVSSSSFNVSGDRVTVTFQFQPSVAGSVRMLAQGIDRELQSTGMIAGPTFSVTGS